MPLEPTTAGVPNHCSPLDADISTVEGVSQGDSASLMGEANLRTNLDWRSLEVVFLIPATVGQAK